MAANAGPGDIALLRLAAHRLAGSAQVEQPTDAAVAVRWMTAMQGQDLPGAMTSVALRTRDRDRSGIVAALDDGRVVRSWPMRGTLHLVAADDLAWMLDLTADRLMAGAARRRAALDLTDADIERARELAVGALVGGRRLRRAELVQAWDDGGLAIVGQRGYHLIWSLAQTGTLCWGPLHDSGEQMLVLLDEWVPAPRRLEREEALGEWALRYFRSHGPATRADFSWWTGLVAADVRVGIELARPALAEHIVDGVEYLMDPQTPDRLAASRRRVRVPMLLPGFDEYLLGYRDRSAVLPGEFAQRVCPGANGVFAPTVVAAGQVVGTWRRVGTGARRRLEATPFTAFAPAVEKALPASYSRLP